MSGAVRSATEHELAHEMLDASQLRRRFPVFRIDDDWIGLFEEQAGWLAPERCIAAHLALAERRSAELLFGEPVEAWSDGPDGVRVTTAVGTYQARRLVIAAGAWMSQLLPALEPYLWVERNVLFWFAPLAREHAFAAVPVWIMEDVTHPDGFPAYRNYYGFPLDGEHGVKVAGLHFGDRIDPDNVEREPRALDEERVRAFLRRRMPDANGERRLAKVCMYTNSADRQFIIDRVLGSPVVYASACSGHGFKFASAIGEILADLTMRGHSSLAIGFLSSHRLASGTMKA